VEKPVVEQPLMLRHNPANVSNTGVFNGLIGGYLPRIRALRVPAHQARTSTIMGDARRMPQAITVALRIIVPITEIKV
jgi:hypothetical protein